jgi:hypothetical protein
VNHLHLPVQHGSDRILMAMKRGYTAMEYKSTIRKLRAVRPDISLSSDFIVGFPGETDDDFERTMKLIDDVGFDASFSFVFSPRPGTPAANLPDDTPQALKLQRLQQLQARSRQRARISASRVGTVQRILVEGPSRKDANELMGRTECNRIVNFDGGPQAARLVGQMIDVQITEALPHSLRGTPVLRRRAGHSARARPEAPPPQRDAQATPSAVGGHACRRGRRAPARPASPPARASAPSPPGASRARPRSSRRQSSLARPRRQPPTPSAGGKGWQVPEGVQRAHGEYLLTILPA